MSNQESMCWTSKESTNNDHRYHTFKDCPSVKRIKDHGNLIAITVGEARRRGLPYCHFCQIRSEQS